MYIRVTSAPVTIYTHSNISPVKKKKIPLKVRKIFLYADVLRSVIDFFFFEARSKKTYGVLNYTLKIIPFQIGNTCSVFFNGLNNYSHNIKTAS